MTQAEPLAAGLTPAVRTSAGAPWELFAQQVIRHEIHFNGTEIGLVRGPLSVQGYGLRLFRPQEKGTRVGFAASNRLDPGSMGRTIRRAEAAAQYATFPAPKLTLPGPTGPLPRLSVVDDKFRSDPLGVLDGFVSRLLASFASTPHVVPSFGSIRASYAESSLENSEGLFAQFATTEVEFEIAVTASGGPEGAPPGEFWVNRKARRVHEGDLGVDVAGWATMAQDMRRAGPPTSGPATVIFPPEMLAEIVPPILGFRLSGPAELRKIGAPVGSAIAHAGLSVWEDGHLPWGTGTQPVDDEGTPVHRRVLLDRGTVSTHVYDALHASALDGPTTGNATRAGGLEAPWYRFATGLGVRPTNLVVPPGAGGSMDELAEAAGDGLCIVQLGAAFPDPIAGTFGGEIRAAYRIRGGKIAEPVRGGTVGGPVLAATPDGTLLGNVRTIGGHPSLVGAFHSAPWIVDRVAVAGPT